MFSRVIVILLTPLLLFCMILSSPTGTAAAPAPKTQEANPSPRPAVQVGLLSMSLGGSAYVLSFALAEIVNKSHPWIRVSATETRGPVPNLVTMTNEPERRKNTFFFTQESSNSVARQGLPPFKEPYTGARAIAAFSETTVLLVTLDKSIKTKANVDGKRVMVLTKGNPSALLHTMLLNDIWGLKVKLSNGTFDAIKDALQDGLADVGSLAVNSTPGVGYVPIPSLNELLTTKDVYFVNVPAADVEALVKKSRIAVYPSSVPSRALGDKQITALAGYGQTNGWWADEQMGEEIVYEIAKAIWENADKFKQFHSDGRLITQKTMARVGVPEELFHPGALKFYKEKGIKPGLN